jgi:[ribosomal protein S5]-alanine N-acetyltransferase
MASPVPAGWPEFPEAIGFSAAKLKERPDEADWWMHFFLDPDGPLVGSGGFVGPPEHGVAEIGYEIAHTLTHQNPSTSVLKRLGFRLVGEVPHGEEGSVWEWRLDATAC